MALEPLPENKQLTIALDYDQTFTADPDMWLEIVKLMQARGHEVVVVTMRHFEEFEGGDTFAPTDDRLHEIVHRWIPTGRKAKKAFCESYGIKIDIWIDDNPMFILVDAKG